MHPYVEEVLRQLDRSRASLRAAIEEVPASRRGVKPAEDRWSVAQVVEHLALVERAYMAQIAEVIAAARLGGVASETGARIALPADVVAILSDRANRRSAPEHLVPSGTADADTAIANAEAVRQQFRSMVESVEGLALTAIVYPHRRFGPFDLYQWVEFFAGHEMRHAAQIREIAGQLNARQRGEAHPA